MALTKADIANNLVNRLNFNKNDSKQYVEVFFNELTNGIVTNGEVKLSGFGNFVTRDKKERPGRNPKTGEYVKISGRRVVTFKAGQKLKARVESLAQTHDARQDTSHLD